MLPEPALTFTIPSLHDGTRLDCRVYHPASLAATNPSAPPWKKHAAVLAHPYAPMGGSYDDPVLGSVAATLLGAGYLVGTFNFRYVFVFCKQGRDLGADRVLRTHLEAQDTLQDELLGLPGPNETTTRAWLDLQRIMYTFLIHFHGS